MAAPLSDRLAAGLWARAELGLRARPPSPRPTLVVMAGVPLSGKTTLARALVEGAAAATLHVENDTVRAEVARALGDPEPRHTAMENFVTYRATWALAGLALRAGANAVHDGTNLTESGRRGAYQAADAAGGRVAVVIVRTAPAILEARAAREGPDRAAAYRKLGRRDPAPRAGRPFVVLDGALPVGELLAALRAWPELRALWEGPWISG